MLRSLLVLCLLAGCADSNTGSDNLREYLARLERITGEPIPDERPLTRELDLPRGQTPTATTSNQIDLIDFLSLSGCALQVNLGRRNTQLGRTASPSQRLLLDLEFMRLAPDCSALLKTRGNAELANTLERARQEREQALQTSIANAILMGPEWEAFWERPKTLAHYPADTNSQVASALGRLAALSRQWLDSQSMTGDWAANNRNFELLLSELRAGDGGALVMAYSSVAHNIARATAMLTSMNETAPLCPFGQRTQRSETFENIVSRFFIGDVQPWLVALRQRKEVLLAPVQQLEQPLLGAMPPQYAQWADRRDRLLSSDTTLIKRHIDAIQSALAECGRSSTAIAR